MKRIYKLILFAILAVALTTTVSAASGSCGANAVWKFDTERKLLTISGTGELSYELNCGPWYDYNADIKKVIIEEGITKINDHAFSGCTALKDIIFPSTLETIEQGAFYGCSSLKNVTIPDSVTTIEHGAFTYSGLESITLSSGMTLLDQATFSYCHALKTVIIPDSIMMIKGFVFYQCDSLETIYYTGSETEWGKIPVDDYEEGNYPLYGDVDIVFEYKPESQTGAADSNANIDLSGKRYVQSSLQIFGYDYIPDEGFAFSDPTTSSPPYVEFTDSGSGIIYLWNSYSDYYVDFRYTVDDNTITLYAADNDTFGGTDTIVMEYDAQNHVLEVIDLNMPSDYAMGWTVCNDIFSFNSSVTATVKEERESAKEETEAIKKAETEQQSKDTAEDDTSIWSTVVTFGNTPETEAETISIPDDFDVAFETIKSMPAYKGIRTPEQLDAIRYDLSGHYILLNDIDMAEWGNWEPIGKGTLPFSGIFDGNGYCIQNLTFALDNSENTDNPSPDYCGLFAAVYKAKIQNVYLENALYTVTSSDPTVGGIVGRASEYSCITNCHFQGTILCNSTYYPPEIGGIAGEADCVTTIEFCVSQGSIEASGYMNPSVGGIVGSCTGIEIDDHDANSEVCYCYSDCAITLLDTYNPARIGGIAGHVSIGAIQDCYYTGKITILYGSAYVGGIVGTLNGSINNCYSVGEIISETQQQTIGGIIGARNRSFAENPIVNRCYILSGLYERGIGKDECGTKAVAIQSISDMEMKDPDTYTDWDFDSVWLVDPAVNNGYPVLRQPVMEQMVIETQVDTGRIIFVSLIILGGGMIVFSLIQTILNLAKNKTKYRRRVMHDPQDTPYMECKKCGHINDHNAAFCGNCGTRLQD